MREKSERGGVFLALNRRKTILTQTEIRENRLAVAEFLQQPERQKQQINSKA